MIPIIHNSNKEIEVIDSEGKMAVADIQLAAVIGEVLASAYPGYSWWAWSDLENGVAGFRCGEINVSLGSHLPYGINLKITEEVNHKTLSRKVVFLGGELLERASLPRSRWNGDFPTKVDGVKDAHQPLNILRNQSSIVGL